MVKESEATIKQIIPRTHDVTSFRLEVKEEIDFKPGQFLSVTLNADKELTHYLSISNSPTEKGYLEFTKKITQSEFSKVLNNAKAADKVSIKYPYGTFTFQGEDKKIAFLCGGIGITPIRSICKYAVDKKTGTDIMLIYANRSTRDIAFKEDFDAMQKEYPNLRVVYVISQAEAAWPGRVGLINAQLVKDEVADYAQRKFYLCGAPGMVEAMKKMLSQELALSKESIITENFVGY